MAFEMQLGIYQNITAGSGQNDVPMERVDCRSVRPIISAALRIGIWTRRIRGWCHEDAMLFAEEWERIAPIMPAPGHPAP